MGEETDDHGARRSAKPAVCAGYRATLRGAHYHFAPGWGVDGVGAVAWQDDDDGTAIHVRQFIGFGEGIGRQIDPEPVPVREPDASTIAGSLRGVADHRLVRVSPTATALVGADQLSQHAGVDVIAFAR